MKRNTAKKHKKNEENPTLCQNKYLHQNFGTFLYKEPFKPPKMQADLGFRIMISVHELLSVGVGVVVGVGVGVGVGSFLAEDFRQLLYVLDGVFESLDLGQWLSSAAVDRRQVIP